MEVGLASRMATQNEKGATMTELEKSHTGNGKVQVTAVASLGSTESWAKTIFGSWIAYSEQLKMTTIHHEHLDL